MAPRLTELCDLLVEEKFGPLAADVFTTLARRGRLVLSQLQQHTSIPIRYLKTTICALITHNILLWHQADDNELVYYQVDWHAAYVLVRQSKIVTLVEKRHGRAARQILETILERGKVEVGELEDEQYFPMASPRDSGIGMMDDQVSEEGVGNGEVNGHGIVSKTNDEEQITTVASFHDSLRSLLEDGFLTKCTSRDHIPVAELEDQLRNEVISADPRTFKDGKTTGPKTAVAFIHASNSLKRKWHEESEYSPQRDVTSHGIIKRKRHSTSGSNKRRKINGRLSDGLHDFYDEYDEDDVQTIPSDCSVQKLPSDMWLRVNYNKCMVAHRTKSLERIAQDCLGPMSAAVYGAVLLIAESKTHAVRSQLRAKSGFSIDDDGEAIDDAQITINDAEILEVLNKDLDLSSTIKDTSGTLQSKSSQGTTKNSKKRRLVPADDEDVADVGIKKEVESDDDDVEPVLDRLETPEQRQKRLNQIGLHLDLLGESSKEFLKRSSDKRSSTVSFALLSKLLVDSEVDQMILARSGPIGLRIIRILREKGRLLDTQIAGMCLKRLKDLRAVLTNLQHLGFIDVQELPKDNYRQPSRTTYLWHFDEQSVRQEFLQQSYLAMSRSLTRLGVERERNKDIIEKAESVDWNMKRLNKPERDLLARWKATEEQLTTTVEGLDHVVMVLRDIEELDTSLLT